MANKDAGKNQMAASGQFLPLPDKAKNIQECVVHKCQRMRARGKKHTQIPRARRTGRNEENRKKMDPRKVTRGTKGNSSNGKLKTT
mmetsp:Transcript_37118/g.73050  ORF Transcript_37118/g.73050 Transcript_37118/m.73050 type:complete len:86 (-) Transcript_37118:387-644(-)